MAFSLGHVIIGLLTGYLPLLLSEGSVSLGLYLPLVVVVGITFCHWVEAQEMRCWTLVSFYC